MVSPPTITNFEFESLSELPPLGDTSFVRVTTTCIVRLPAPLFFYGTEGAEGTVPFSQSYAYPILAALPEVNGHSWAACRPKILPRRMVP